MIDIRFLRENPDVVRENIRKKFQDEKLPLVDEVIALDASRRAAIAEVESLKAARNKFSKANGPLYGRLKKCADDAERAEHDLRERHDESVSKEGVFDEAIAAIKFLQEKHPDVDIYAGALDDHLNEKGYIVPGLGDASDRIFGTK